MRASEFLTERHKLTKSARSAIPGAVRSGSPGDPDGPNNYYHKYRLGVAMAGAPNKEDHVTTDGPANDDMVMVAYTDADKEIIDAGHKKMGYTKKSLSTSGSKELNDTNKTSPVASPKRNKYGI